MKPSDSPERRSDLLGRLQETEDRHNAAELESQAAQTYRVDGEQIRALREAIEELRIAIDETRQMNFQMRDCFRDLLAELRRS